MEFLCYFGNIIHSMVLVTGATGFVGSHLLFYLLGKDVRIRALYRHKKSIEKVRNLFSLYHPTPQKLLDRIEWIPADITDISSLEQVVENIDKIYHLAAVVDFSSLSKNSLYQVNVEGTKNLLTLATEKKIKKFFYMSSIASLGSYDQPITEKTFWNWKEKGSSYAKTKFLAEMEVWRASQEGLDVVIGNPSIILGAGFWHEGAGKIFDKVYKGLKFYPSGANAFIDVWDVVKASYLLMESKYVNESFILSSQNISYKRLLEMIAQNFKVKAPSIALKKWMFYPIFPVNFVLKNLLKVSPVIDTDLINPLFSEKKYSNKKFRDTFDFQFIPMDITIQNICNKYLQSPKL